MRTHTVILFLLCFFFSKKGWNGWKFFTTTTTKERLATVCALIAICSTAKHTHLNSAILSLVILSNLFEILYAVEVTIWLVLGIFFSIIIIIIPFRVSHLRGWQVANNAHQPGLEWNLHSIKMWCDEMCRRLKCPSRIQGQRQPRNNGRSANKTDQNHATEIGVGLLFVKAWSMGQMGQRWR